MRDWLTGGGILLVAALFLGIMAGAGAFTADRGYALAYLSDDPKACVHCHVMREAHTSWERSSHRNVAKCVDCHLPQDPVGHWIGKARDGWNHSVAFTLQTFEWPIQLKPRGRAIVEQSCVYCHHDLVSGIVGARTGAGAHAGLKAGKGSGISCLHCHLDVGHGR
jgi:cytochrome c nitrite reductase small subunit